MKYLSTLLAGMAILYSIDLTAQISFSNKINLFDFGFTEGFDTHMPFYSCKFDNDEYPDIIIRKKHQIIFRKNINGTELGAEQVIYQNDEIIISISDFVDLNNDGHLDFIMTSYDSIFLMLGNGHSFNKEKYFYSEGFYHGMPSIFDLNKDGSPDLIFTSLDKIYVNLNWKSDFNAFTELTINNNEQIYSLDFFEVNDGDNLYMLVNTYQNNRLYVGFEKNFELKKTVVGDHQSIWDFGDINMDGYNDIVLHTSNADIIAYLYDLDNKCFTEKNITEKEEWKYFHGPCLIDIDQNGTLDLLYYQGQEVNQKLNLGNSEFQDPVQFAKGPFQGVNKNIKVDFNNDGQIDLIHGGFGVFNILIIKPEYESELLEEYFWTSFNDTQVGLIDNDNIVDIISVNIYGSLEILWGDLNDKYNDHTSIKIPYGARYAHLSDVDNDGVIDILLLNQGNITHSGMQLIKGLGDRQFSEPIPWKNIHGISRFIAIDSDLDGKDEFLVFNTGGSTISRYFPGNTDYIEIQTDPRSTIYTNSQYLVQIDIIDINNDQYPDILTACLYSNKLGILINDTNGGFIETNIPFSGGVYSIASFDYNNDSWEDVLVLVYKNDNTFELNVLLNNQLGEVELYTKYMLTGLHFPYNMEKIDLDNDLDSDIVISNFDYSRSIILEKVVDTLIYRGNHLIPDMEQSSRTFADINDDGLVDFVGGQFSDGILFLVLNNSVISPTSPVLEISYDTIQHNQAKVFLNNIQTSGTIGIIKQGSGLSFIPEDGKHYAKNSSFGVGYKVEENAYVVFAGSDTTFLISNLKSNTTYELSVFEYNSNVPDNTIINYGSESVVSTFTTQRAIFAVKDFGDTITINEDSVLILELTEFINDFGGNNYVLTNKNPKVKVSLSGTSLTITPDKDYYGMDSLSITASFSTESLQLSFYLHILPVNDPPLIEEIETVVINTDAIGITETIMIAFEDPDSETENLRMEVTSSNQNVVPNESIKVTVYDNELKIEYNSAGYGISVITVKITDESGAETILTFNLEVSKITSIDDLGAVQLIYPNPTNGMVYFNKELSDNLSTGTIFNAVGEIVMKDINLNSGELNVSQLKPGIYLLKSERFQFKIVKE